MEQCGLTIICLHINKCLRDALCAAATFYYFYVICLYVPSNSIVWITLKLGRRVHLFTEEV